MEIIISNSSDKPIYEQICMQVKSFIMDGTLSAGEALPSMRALAKDLHISVITVQRAYEDLTRDGFIETVSGKGSFVASQNREFIQEEQLRMSGLDHHSHDQHLNRCKWTKQHLNADKFQ